MQTPEKPNNGEPCNGCGHCCAAEVCHIAEMVFGREVEAPCPAMQYHDGRFWCGVVEAEAAANVEPIIAKSLGIGTECQADLD